MGELTFANDVQSQDFQEKVADLMKFLNKEHRSDYYRTVCIIVNDNIKLFNRVKELEDGKTITTGG